MEAESSELEKFAQTVRKFCRWIEQYSSGADEQMKMLMHFLVDLHFGVLRLPESKTDDDLESDPVSQEEWQDTFARLKSLPLDNYWMIFNPLEKTCEEPVAGSLADDLADIYRDLKSGLSLYDAGNKDAAISRWRLNFKWHWGRHLTSALYALHCFVEEGASGE